jgi:hypothetical protein
MLAGMGRRQRRRNRQARQHAISPAAVTTAAATAAPIQHPLAPPPVANLDRLARLVDQARALHEQIDLEVDHLATTGVSWPVIATVLGVSRQAARQRYQRRHAPGQRAPSTAAETLAS